MNVFGFPVNYVMLAGGVAFILLAMNRVPRLMRLPLYAVVLLGVLAATEKLSAIAAA